MKSGRMAKRSSFGSIVRKRLSDITNSQSQPKLIAQDEIQLPFSDPSGDLINQLLKEKASLMKLVEEKDKAIAATDIQMRNLRLHYQKLQLQNWHLAQSNSQMLAELNVGREKVKALQHELACKDALLKAKNSISEEEEKKNEAEMRADGDDKTGKRIRRRTARSQSMGPCTTSKQRVQKEKLENKRRCVRRQSERFETENKEKLFEIEISKEETRCSIGRPIRKAAEKVQSYKETPINVKMRRDF